VDVTQKINARKVRAPRVNEAKRGYIFVVPFEAQFFSNEGLGIFFGEVMNGKLGVSEYFQAKQLLSMPWVELIY
jgi:hypothetical protein